MLVKIKKYYLDPNEIVEMNPEEYTDKEKDIIVYRLKIEIKNGNIKGYDFDTNEDRKAKIKEILSITNKD